MLQRELKKIANESLFNPNRPNKVQEILLDVGNPVYFATKALEYIKHALSYEIGSKYWHDELKDAITVLILARVCSNGEKEKVDTRCDQETRSTNSDS